MSQNPHANTQRTIPVHRKPGGYSRGWKLVGVIVLVGYVGMLVSNSSVIAAMSLTELLWYYALPTLMGGVTLAMVLFDVSLGYPDDAETDNKR